MKTNETYSVLSVDGNGRELQRSTSVPTLEAAHQILNMKIQQQRGIHHHIVNSLGWPVTAKTVITQQPAITRLTLELKEVMKKDQERENERQRLLSLLFNLRDNNKEIQILIKDNLRTYGFVNVPLDDPSEYKGKKYYTKPHNYKIEVAENDQDISQVTRAFRENSSKSHAPPLTTQRKEWPVEIDVDEYTNPYLFITIDPAESWSFLKDRRFKREANNLPRSSRELTLTEIETLRSVKNHKKIRPDGSQNYEATILSSLGYLEFLDKSKPQLTAKGVEMLAEASSR